MDRELLEPLCCPKGCPVQFIQYLVWEGGAQRIAESYQVYVPETRTHETIYDLGLRCGDCGTQYGRKGVPYYVKLALDSLLASVSDDIQDLVDQVDTDRVNEMLGGTLEVIEDS